MKSQSQKESEVRARNVAKMLELEIDEVPGSSLMRLFKPLPRVPNDFFDFCDALYVRRGQERSVISGSGQAVCRILELPVCVGCRTEFVHLTWNDAYCPNCYRALVRLCTTVELDKMTRTGGPFSVWLPAPTDADRAWRDSAPLPFEEV